MAANAERDWLAVDDVVGVSLAEVEALVVLFPTATVLKDTQRQYRLLVKF